MNIMTLSCEDVISMHDDLVNEFGGLLGVRDYNILDGSDYSYLYTFGGVFLIEAMAAHLAFSLIVWCLGIVLRHQHLFVIHRSSLDFRGF
jgi:hypothetical protein